MLFSPIPQLSPIVSSQGSRAKVQSRTVERVKRKSCSFKKGTYEEKKKKKAFSAFFRLGGRDHRELESWAELAPCNRSVPEQPVRQACTHGAPGTLFSA